MKLEETIPMMTSSDYKERFKAEYYQLKIRHEKLYNMLLRWGRGELDFQPTCPRVLLQTQEVLMCRYMSALEARAKIEGIELD